MTPCADAGVGSSVKANGSSIGFPLATRFRDTGPSPGAGDGAMAYAWC